MAFGLRCKRCGCQETEHEYAEDYGACREYQSPDKRAEKQMWKDDAEKESQYQKQKRRGWAYET